MGERSAWVIYLILLPNGGAYIGATRDLSRRMREHKRTFGFVPSPEILARGDSIEWRTAEHAWIERFRRDGVCLANKTAGRNGVESLSAEARAKLSQAAKGRRKSEDTKARIRAVQKGRPKNWSAAGLRSNSAPTSSQVTQCGAICRMM